MWKGLLTVTLATILVWTFTGCKSECKDVKCLNDGTCKSGTCDCKFQYGGKYCDSACPIGYEGLNCSTEIRQKYIRTWSATTNSTAGGSVQHTLTVTAGSAISYINISNFNNEGFTVIGIVSDKYAFAIYQQNATGNYTGIVSGSGTISGSRLSINLTKQGGETYFVTANP